LAAGVAVAAWSRAPRARAESRPAPTVVINLTSGKEDLHKVTMAYQLANHALDAGREVVLFLNVRGPELGSKQLSSKLAFHQNPPIRKMLTDLVARGATVLACPTCMEVLSLNDTDLLDGIVVADREKLFGNLGLGSVVFSY